MPPTAAVHARISHLHFSFKERVHPIDCIFILDAKKHIRTKHRFRAKGIELITTNHSNHIVGICSTHWRELLQPVCLVALSKTPQENSKKLHSPLSHSSLSQFWIRAHTRWSFYSRQNPVQKSHHQTCFIGIQGADATWIGNYLRSDTGKQ